MGKKALMMTPQTVNSRTRQHNHKVNGNADEALCPYCGRPISRKEFEEIRARIEAEGRTHVAEVERNLKDRFAREQQQATAKAQAEIDKAKRDAAAQTEKTKREAAAREVAIRQEASKAATAALVPKIAEAVNAEKTRAFAEKLKLTEQLQEMQRRLEKKTPGDLGDEPEIDLFETLKAEFIGDRISRIARGAPGADVVHEIIHNGVVAGKIVYDSKNHKRWQNRFTAKLRQDQLAHCADHAVLSSAAFPAGARQLHVQDGVLVAHPGRVVTLAIVLRRHIVQLHTLRAAADARREKTAELYHFITSDRCGQLLDQIGTFTDDMAALDAKEQNAHEATWKRRGELIRAVQRLKAEFTHEIERIIGTGAISLAGI
jgi:hypothetical protein